MAQATAIRVRGLAKSYGDAVAVDGIDLDVALGECFALLGPNGAGKTSTVEILEGYRRRTAGEVTVLDTDPAHPSRAWRARVGIVLQSTSTEFDALTVGEVIRHFAAYYPAPRDPDEVIAAVGLTDKVNARCIALSGGQRRRLDVALGVIGHPELLFLDEPTTGFDPEARLEFWELIKSLRGEGTTILLTTHYLEEAEELADRVGVIAAGQLLEVNPPAILGGRDQAATVVSWDAVGGRQSHATATPTAFVQKLASELGGEIPGLTVARPTLEDIYLAMIGKGTA
ncbi:MAG TPA: ABC transporter ATP-binding protein [Micromonosporaceae bacterium]|jgi:ABC-2 type transport system ATP-binding protein|nr:ABC transporter ATP-binding protein [Micromonosporaceae bacterium]